MQQAELAKGQRLVGGRRGPTAGVAATERGPDEPLAESTLALRRQGPHRSAIS